MAELNDYFYLLFFQSSMKYMEIPILKLSKKKKNILLSLYQCKSRVYQCNLDISSTSIKQIVLKKKKIPGYA